MIVSCISFSFAQTGTAKTTKHASHKTATTQSAGTQSATDTSAAASKSTSTKRTVAHNGTRLKKDGTPDKRYKANKKG